MTFQYLNGDHRKDGDKLLVVPYSSRTRANNSKIKKYSQTRYRKETFLL